MEKMMFKKLISVAGIVYLKIRKKEGLYALISFSLKLE